MRAPLPRIAMAVSALVAAAAARAASPLPYCPDQAFAVVSAAQSGGGGPVAGLAGLPLRRPVGPQEPISVLSEAAQFAIAGDAQISGQVVLRQGDRQLAADSVHVDKARNGVDLDGSVEYRDPQLAVSGSRGRYEAGAASIQDARFSLLRQAGRGSAATLSLDREGYLRLTQVEYTTCPPETPDWTLRAASVSIDSREQVGVARNARVEFKGVPILYLPYLSFPAGPARKSGFLFPQLGNSSRSGLQLSVPYYFNLAPNRDLTLEPTLYTQRGLSTRAELRYLTARSRGQIEGDYLPSDRVLGRDRYRLRIADRTELPLGWRAALDAERVSDVNYFEDFAQGADGTSIAFLPRSLQLSYRDDHWRTGALLRQYQTIDQQLADVDRPYIEAPRLYASGWWPGSRDGSLEYGFDGEVVQFLRNVGVQGWRADVAPRAELRFEGAGYSLRPAVSYRATAYELDRTAAGEDASLWRGMPVVSVDGGLTFERAAGRNGGRRITLEPRLMYLYVPYRDQSAFPVFDSGLPDLNFVELFRNNRYVGADRMGDANQLSMGLTTRLFSSRSGQRYLSATLGQIAYFETPRVRLPDEPLRTRSSSDLIAQVELKALDNWSLDLGVQYDRQLSRAEKTEIRAQYRPEGGRVVNLGYRFQRDRLEQADVSMAWPVNPRWSLYGRTLYSLRDKRSIEQFAGLQYSSCCWGLRAVARHYVSTRTGERDTGVFLQLELRGLSSVGTAADAFLERAIRGYSPADSSRMTP
ncbi:MAG: hypothetical protein RL026_931 [Pseudomonadota bacterium]